MQQSTTQTESWESEHRRAEEREKESVSNSCSWCCFACVCVLVCKQYTHANDCRCMQNNFLPKFCVRVCVSNFERREHAAAATATETETAVSCLQEVWNVCRRRHQGQFFVDIETRNNNSTCLQQQERVIKFDGRRRQRQRQRQRCLTLELKLKSNWKLKQAKPN